MKNGKDPKPLPAPVVRSASEPLPLDRMRPTVKPRTVGSPDLLPRYGELSHIIQVSNLNRKGAFALARALAWASFWEKTTGNDAGYRLIETLLFSTMAVGGQRAKELAERLEDGPTGPGHNVFMLAPPGHQHNGETTKNPVKAAKRGWRLANRDKREPEKPRRGGLFD